MLDDYDREKIGEMLSLPAGIVNLSFQRTKLVYSQLKELLNNISTLASLNVVDTDLKSNDVEMLVNKRPIGKLFIS